MSDISKNIKKYRSKTNLTQQELADRLNVTRQAVSSWENGKNQPDVQTLELLAKEFEIGIEELIYGDKKSERLKKQLITRAVVLTVICVLGFIVLYMINADVQYWVETHYIVWPRMLLVFIVEPSCCVLAGCAGVAILRIFWNVHVKCKHKRRCLLIVGIVMAIIIPVFDFMYFYIDIAIINDVTRTIMEMTLYVWVVWFFVSGAFIYLGASKEPAQDFS